MVIVYLCFVSKYFQNNYNCILLHPNFSKYFQLNRIIYKQKCLKLINLLKVKVNKKKNRKPFSFCLELYIVYPYIYHFLLTSSKKGKFLSKTTDTFFFILVLSKGEAYNLLFNIIENSYNKYLFMREFEIFYLIHFYNEIQVFIQLSKYDTI